MSTKDEKVGKSVDAVIWTEGKTDWMHLKRAMEILNIDLNIRFEEDTKDMGGPELLSLCEKSARNSHVNRLIYIFDRDDKKITDKVENGKSEKSYKTWGNQVFSFAIPVPDHREKCNNLCIEFYYSDNEIRTRDLNDRRIFLSSEFKKTTGRHKEDSSISVFNADKVKKFTNAEDAKIVDDDVFNDEEQNIALTKKDFATQVLNGNPPFDSFSFENFRIIFEIIEDIINDSKESVSLFSPNKGVLRFDLPLSNVEEQIANISNQIIKTCKVSIYIFVGTVVRFYESEIVSESSRSKKKLKEIRNINEVLLSQFGEPSLEALCELLKSCDNLVDKQAPKEILDIKNCFRENFQLGALGDLFDYFEEIFPLKEGTARITNRSTLSRNLVDFLLPELSKYESRLSASKKLMGEVKKTGAVNLDVLQQALDHLTAIFETVFKNDFSASSETINKNSKEEPYTVDVTTYSNGSIKQEQKIINQDDIDTNMQHGKCNILVRNGSEQVSLELFPFLTIDDGEILFYSRQRAPGY